MKPTHWRGAAACTSMTMGIRASRALPAAIFVTFLLATGAAWARQTQLPCEDRAGVRQFGALLNAALVDAVRRSSPSVVSVITTRFDFDPAHPGGAILPSGADKGSSAPPGGSQRPNPVRKTGIGSGTIVRILGKSYVLTNQHVVHGVDRILVQLADAREFEAYVKGWDSKVDIAVLELPDADGLAAIPMGNSDELRVGELVLTVGSPFGLPHTVTVGIVSAVGRYAQGIEEYEDFIQTDAPINRGNSGGPLLNIKGEAVGLNTAIRTTHMGGNVGIGFAIPMNMIMPVAEQLVTGGFVVRGWLGASVQNVTADLARAFSLSEPAGVVVTKVVSGSPAEQAGLDRGDIIVLVGEIEVLNANKLRNSVAATKPGTRIKLAAIRRTRRIELTVTVGTGPYAEDEFRPPPRKKWDSLGMAVQDVTADIAAAIGLPSPGGALITEIEPGGPAGQARPVPLARGDVILEGKGKTIRGAGPLHAMLKNCSPGERVLLFISRKGNCLFTVVRIPGVWQEVLE